MIVLKICILIFFIISIGNNFITSKIYKLPKWNELISFKSQSILKHIDLIPETISDKKNKIITCILWSLINILTIVLLILLMI